MPTEFFHASASRLSFLRIAVHETANFIKFFHNVNVGKILNVTFNSFIVDNRKAVAFNFDLN